MKIDFYISSLSGGGAEKVLITVAEKFAQQGHDVTVFSLEKRPQFYFPSANVKVVKMEKSKNKAIGVFNDFLMLRKYVKGSDADVSISFLSRCNILLILSCLFNKRKLIVCDRNNPRMEHSFLAFIISQILYLRANKIVVQTKKIESMYINALKRKLIVIENPLNFEKLDSELIDFSSEDVTNRIISMGRLEPQKDFITLIDAFDIISSDYPDWVLDIYGHGNQEEMLLNHISTKQHGNKINLCGRTTTPFREMKKSKIFVLSSFYEGFPNVLCEAMYAQKICISSNCISGPSELIEDGVNGYLFDVQDTGKLAKLLDYSMSNYNKLEKVRLKAKLSTNKLDHNENFSHWENLVFSIIK